MNKDTKVNSSITAPVVRLVDGETNAVIDLSIALRLASEAGLDLVQVNDNDVPVCKIMDYKKYVYDQKTAEKQKLKAQRTTTVQVKEVSISIDIQEHDCNVKRKSISKFLTSGNRVRVNLKLTGRARGNAAMISLAVEKVTEFISKVHEKCDKSQVTHSGDLITVTLSPTKE